MVFQTIYKLGNSIGRSSSLSWYELFHSNKRCFYPFLGNAIEISDPKCGPITVDEKVICDSDGYKCPAEHLVIVYQLMCNKTWYSLTSTPTSEFNSLVGILFTSTALNGYWTPSMDQMDSILRMCRLSLVILRQLRRNIFFFYISDLLENVGVLGVEMTKFRYAACLFNGNSPRFTYALLVKDTFGCFPGTKLFLVYTKEKTLTTVPVCTKDGWLEQALGAPITSPITNIRCSKWLSSFRKNNMYHSISLAW